MAPRPRSAQKPGTTLWWSLLLVGRPRTRGSFARTPWSWTQLRHPWHQTLCLAEWVLLVRCNLPGLPLIYQPERHAAPALASSCSFSSFFLIFCFVSEPFLLVTVSWLRAWLRLKAHSAEAWPKLNVLIRDKISLWALLTWRTVVHLVRGRFSSRSYQFPQSISLTTKTSVYPNLVVPTPLGWEADEQGTGIRARIKQKNEVALKTTKSWHLSTLFWVCSVYDFNDNQI